MLLLAGAFAGHQIWEKLVLWRGEAQRRLGASGWLLVAAIFMAIVLRFIRAAGEADKPN